MKARELIEQLLKMDQEENVMLQDPNAHGGPFSVMKVTRQTSQGEYPTDWNMPEGYTFILLEN